MEHRDFIRSSEKKELQKWFSGSLFNMLIDHYPEYPISSYGDGATEENVLPVLERLKLGFIIIYAKGHGGHTLFESRLGSTRPMLAQDMLAFYRKMTKRTGTKLFLYYSGLLDQVAAEAHPEWRMLRADGTPHSHMGQFGGLCPRSAYFDQWLRIHFEEIVEIADPDGIWVDGDWPGPCYCDRCMTAYKEYSGSPLSLEELHAIFAKENEIKNRLKKQEQRIYESEYLLSYDTFWAETTRAWRDQIANLCQQLKPAMLYSSGNVCPLLEYSYQCDWKSGDWFSPNGHRLMQSIICRRYTTQHIPYDVMTCDTSVIHSRPHLRSRTKPLDRMLQEGAGVLANGGQWCYWTYPMPNAALIPSKIKNAAAASDFAHERADVALHSESLKWTAILDTSKATSLGKNIFGAGKAMISAHLSPDIIDRDALKEGRPYRLIVIPEQATMDAQTVDYLKDFVAKGGNVFASGSSLNSAGMEELLGVRPVKDAILKEGHIMPADGMPLGIDLPFTGLELKGAEKFYPVYRSINDRNPLEETIDRFFPIGGEMDEENPEEYEHPCVTINQYGKGKAAYISTELFNYYWHRGDWQILHWLKEVFKVLEPAPLFETDAPSWIEVSLREQKERGRMLIHFVNGNPGRDISYVNTNDLWVDEIPTVGGYTFRIALDKAPKNAYFAPDNTPAPFTYEKGYATFTLDRLHIHRCLVIEK